MGNRTKARLRLKHLCFDGCLDDGGLRERDSFEAIALCIGRANLQTFFE